MDYNVGQEYAFIHIASAPNARRFGARYIPWDDALKEIRIEVMECVDHQKVPSYWASGEERQQRDHDGFAFIDRFGELWGCNYHSASFGQLDDSSRFRAVSMEGLRMRQHDDIWGIVPRFEALHYRLDLILDGALQMDKLQKKSSDLQEIEELQRKSRMLLDLQASIRLALAFQLKVHSEVVERFPALTGFKQITFRHRSEVPEDKFLASAEELHRQVNASDYALGVMKKITIV